MTQLLISAARKSSGKTTITLGLCATLAQRGRVVQPFKKGPDFIDPMWLGEAAQRACHNLDFYTMGRAEILATFARYAQDADICLIEGNKGLYDGLDLDGSNSNAALATLLGAPVVLVIDARGMTRGIAPLILGYQAFDRNIDIAGVILSQLGGSRHEAKLRAVVEHYTDVPVLGAVHHDPALEIVERHLGLMPSGEAGETKRRIGCIAHAVAQQVDIERLSAIAVRAMPLGITVPTLPPYPHRDVRLGIVRDAAFSFYYPGDLEAMKRAGAELVRIDSLRHQTLPDIDGLFIGGGFPETQMAALERNASLRRQIYHAIEAGMPVYAECGGLMYLARSLAWNGRACRMIGAIPADAIMHDRPMGRGYVRLQETGRGPWPLRDDDGRLAEFCAHEFHHSSLTNLGPGVEFAYRVLRGTGIDGQHDGLVYKNVLASYAHLRDVQGNHWAVRFVEYVRSCKHSRAPRLQSTG